MTVFIRQLTGVRFVAAAWVVLYHLQGPLERLNLLAPGLADVLRVGRLGVDLFFALSGFILTYTYLTRLGPRATWRGSAKFWWLRLARIYPVHFVMLNVAGLAVVAQSLVSSTESRQRDWLNPWDYIKNLLFIQEWGPQPQRGWNFVAWSLSMEWLAYLLFPLLVLVLWRFHQRLSTMLLGAAWLVVLTPLMIFAFGRSDPYYTDNWGSTYRILTEFTAGAITYLLVARFIPEGNTGPRDRIERLATTISVAAPVLIIVGAIVLGRIPSLQPPATSTAVDAEPLPPYLHLLLVPLLILWIGSLALSRRGLSRWLSGDRIVLGGFISYSLYMTHLVVFGLWRAALKAAGISGGLVYALAVVALVAGALLVAWAMWRWVEEPAREWMRGRIGARPRPVAEPEIVHHT